MTLWEKTKGPFMERLINGKKVKYKQAKVDLDDLSPDPKNGRLTVDLMRAKLDGTRITDGSLRAMMEDKADIKALVQSMKAVKQAYDNPVWSTAKGITVDGNRRWYAQKWLRDEAEEKGDHRGVFEYSKIMAIVFEPGVAYEDLMVAVYMIHQDDVGMSWDPACQAAQTDEMLNVSKKMTLQQVALLKGTTTKAITEQVTAYRIMKRWVKFCHEKGKGDAVEEKWSFIKRIVRHAKSIGNALGTNESGAERYLFGLMVGGKIMDCQHFDQLIRVLNNPEAKKLLHAKGSQAAYDYLGLDTRLVTRKSMDAITQKIISATGTIRQNMEMLDDDKYGEQRRNALVTLNRMIGKLIGA